MSVARASAHGAISAVNAIVTGRWGASIAIELRTDAKVTLIEDIPEVEVIIDGEEAGQEGILARLALKAVVARLGEPEWGGRIETTSDIPQARGLKSSSAAANAVVLATNRAFQLYDGRSLSRAELLDAGVEAALDAGVTITGAFDDASASMNGGVQVTDNKERLVLHREPVDDTLRVVLLIPEEMRPTASVAALPYASFAPLATHAHALARQGKWMEAMTLNGLYTAALYSSPPEWAREALAAGALAAGMSGKGPAFAALARPDRVKEVEAALSALAPPRSRLLVTGLTNRRAEALS